MSLRKFMITEAIKASHAAKYFEYVENHHLDIFVELGEALEKRWEKDIVDIQKKFQPNEHRLADLTERRTDAFTGIEVDTRHLALHKNRFSTQKFTSTSVKYSLVYDSTDLTKIKNILMASAVEVFKNVLGKHVGIFGLERNDKVKYLFSITHEDDVIKLMFRTTNENKEQINKTVFLVGVEHGVLTGSKPFNRVFFIDYIK